MPHVAFVPLTGFRIREPEMAALGMSLPGLRQRGAALGQLPALGLLTLAGMTDEPWTCDYRPTARADAAFVEEILSTKPDLVAISALTASINEAYALADVLRLRGVKVIMGGLHVSCCHAETLRHCDAVVIGEGEAIWPRVLADARRGDLQKIYRASDTSAPAPWPMPRFDLLGAAPSRFTIQTQRGCPLACQFCGASRLLGRFREKPAAAIAAELAEIKKLSPRPVVELADDNTFAGARDASELLDVLREANIRYFTESDWRIGRRGDVLAGLAASGCVQVLMGIESLVFRYPGMGEKAAELAAIMDAVHAVQSSGVAVNGCFIVGADGETNASLDRLIEFVLASQLAEVQITLQTPFPGTTLYDKLNAQGRLLVDSTKHERDWSHHTLFDVTYQPDKMPVAELEAGFRRVLAAVFGAEATARRAAIRGDVWRRRPRRSTSPSTHELTPVTANR